MNLITSTKEQCDQHAASVISSFILKNKRTILALVGGRSVSKIYQLLAEKELPWEKVHIFLADERMDGSNFKLIKEKLLNNIKIPKENIHQFMTLTQYNEELKERGGKFDLALLSAGEDCHIASLFPNHPSIKSKSRLFINVKNSPKPPKERISASPSLLSKTTTTLLLFYNKKEAFLNYTNESSVKECPAKILKSPLVYYSK